MPAVGVATSLLLAAPAAITTPNRQPVVSVVKDRADMPNQGSPQALVGTWRAFVVIVAVLHQCSEDIALLEMSKMYCTKHACSKSAECCIASFPLT